MPIARFTITNALDAVDNYNSGKGFLRRIFGKDDEAIRALKSVRAYLIKMMADEDHDSHSERGLPALTNGQILDLVTAFLNHDFQEGQLTQRIWREYILKVIFRGYRLDYYSNGRGIEIRYEEGEWLRIEGMLKSLLDAKRLTSENFERIMALSEPRDGLDVLDALMNAKKSNVQWDINAIWSARFHDYTARLSSILLRAGILDSETLPVLLGFTDKDYYINRFERSCLKESLPRLMQRGVLTKDCFMAFMSHETPGYAASALAVLAEKEGLCLWSNENIEAVLADKSPETLAGILETLKIYGILSPKTRGAAIERKCDPDDLYKIFSCCYDYEKKLLTETIACAFLLGNRPGLDVSVFLALSSEIRDVLKDTTDPRVVRWVLDHPLTDQAEFARLIQNASFREIRWVLDQTPADQAEFAKHIREASFREIRKNARVLSVSKPEYGGFFEFLPAELRTRILEMTRNSAAHSEKEAGAIVDEHLRRSVLGSIHG